ncbi:MAG: response regulator [Candidatus Paceibacterota bacterium]
MSIKKKKGHSIAIIEDEASQRKALSEKFAREGFKVFEAKDGGEGLKLVLKERPDIILLDIMMPDIDGLTMMKKLRNSNKWGKTVPVVLLTNLSADTDDIIKRISEDEPSYYLLKANWSIGDVVDKVNERLSR